MMLAITGSEVSSRPTWVEVQLPRILQNVQEIRSLLSPSTRFMAVVKADAYGLGALPIARALEGEVDAFGVALVEEGMSLREGGITSPIYILGLTPLNQQESLFSHDLTPTICRQEELASLSRLAREREQGIGVQVKVDTGLGRIGILPGDLPSFLEEGMSFPGVSLTGIMSHFSCADSDPDYTQEQYQRFTSWTQGFAGSRHLANSAGTLLHSSYHLDMIRPGLILYGAYPSPLSKSLGKVFLQEVLEWKTRIVHCKTLPPGYPISYGRTYITSRETRVATLPLGYADGYLCRLSNRAQVLIHGKRAPVLGRICMDQLLVDVTDIPKAQVNDGVVLLGEQGGDIISVQEMAGWLETIPYEVLTGIGKRIHRQYV